MQKFKHYNWPGNVSELQNIIEGCYFFQKTKDFQEYIFDDYANFKKNNYSRSIEIGQFIRKIGSMR